MSNSFCKNRGYVVFYCYISSNSVLFLMFWTFVAFNTSHVKVNLAPVPHLLPQLNRFNTSHVKVNRKVRRCGYRLRKVSIHLMLKLIGKARSDYFAGIIVSIHPMLKLIYSPYSILFFNLLVSIHPMLKLISGYYKLSDAWIMFQYIPC